MSRPAAVNGDSLPARPVRDPGDAWVEGPAGERFWGRFGAAGLVAHDPVLGVLLQHRAQWSHYGGTWGIPGGALQQGESAVAAALREAHEEAGVPARAVSLRGTRVIDREVWSYTTLLSDVIEPFEPVVGDAESVELAWVPVADVTELPLHPGFGHAWPAIADLLRTPRIVIVVDAANVVGSVPNGWWKNRLAAAQDLIRRLGVLAATGFPADRLELDATTWNVDVDVIVEGAARGAHAPAEQPGSDALHVVAARGEGDDALVKQVQTRVAEGARVVVVTSDRQLRARVGALGAQYRGAGWLREILPD